MASSTTTPRLTAKPAARASAGVRLDTDGHDQQVARQDAAVLQLQARDLAVFADDLLGMGPHHRLDATLQQGLAQQEAGALVQLALHQDVHQVDDRGGHAAPGQAVGGFQAQQAAADDHGAGAGLAGGGDHGLDVVQVAEGDHALQVDTGQRQAERVRASGQDQLVIGNFQPALGDHLAAFQVDRRDRPPGVQG
jgi:hypothetical protein